VNLGILFMVKKKTKPFHLNIFGVIGIFLIASGISSGILVYYTVMEIVK